MNQTTPMSLDHLVRQAALLDEELRAKGETLRDLKNQIAAAAQYKPGSKTGVFLTSHYQVKVVRRENEKWDQDALNGPIRRALGEEKFFQLFRFKFDPNARHLAGYLEHGPAEHRDLLVKAREVAPGQPQVTFEFLGE